MRNRFDLEPDYYAGFELPWNGDASAYPSSKGRLILTIVVSDTQKALLFKNGIFVKVLEPGRHRFWGKKYSTRSFDMRPTNCIVPSQEVLSKDLVSVRVSLRMRFRVTDPLKAHRSSVNYQEDIYTFAHDAIRILVNSHTISETLEIKESFGHLLLESVRERVSELGCELLEVGVRDFGLPGEFKKAFTQVLIAQEEGKAALERARGESAALRNLANAAQLLENRPELALLRSIQAVEKSGGTIVIGEQTVSGATKPKPVKDKLV